MVNKGLNIDWKTVAEGFGRMLNLIILEKQVVRVTMIWNWNTIYREFVYYSDFLLC